MRRNILSIRIVLMTAVTASPRSRFLWALFADDKNAVLILLNDTDSEVEQTVSLKELSANGVEILDGTKFDFTRGSCKIKFGPRAAQFISFKK